VPLCLRMDDDDADILGGRQGDQVATRQLRDIEGRAAGNGDQLAVIAVGPAVIGADEALAVAAALFRQLHAAVAAGIEERLGLTVLVAGDEDRLAGDVGGEIITGVRQVRRQGDQLRPFQEQLLLLQLEPVLVDEAADIGLPRFRAHEGRVVVDQLHDLLGDRDPRRFFHLILPKWA